MNFYIFSEKITCEKVISIEKKNLCEIHINVEQEGMEMFYRYPL